jgi:hypothetical protein
MRLGMRVGLAWFRRRRSLSLRRLTAVVNAPMACWCAAMSSGSVACNSLGANISSKRAG